MQTIEVVKEKASRSDLLDHFDREVSRLNDIPDVAIDKSKETAIREITFVGQVQTWIIGVYKVEGGATTVTVELSSKEEHTRLVLPPKVVAHVVRQVSVVLPHKGRKRRGRQSNAFDNILPEDRTKYLTKAREAKRNKAKARQRKSR